MYEKFKKRLWWILFVLAILLIIGITNNLDGQDFQDFIVYPIEDGFGLIEDDYGFIVDHPLLTYDIYLNGIELKFDDVPVAFIYGNEPFGFMDDRFQVILITDDIIEIRLRGK